jgi:hypothetical protein
MNKLVVLLFTSLGLLFVQPKAANAPYASQAQAEHEQDAYSREGSDQ